jgi:predicted patatin/cPLA2 family phospholipase
MEFESAENEKDRQNRIYEAQIRSAGFGATVDINQNQKSDYQDALKEINRTQEQNDNINLQREKEVSRMSEHRDKMSIEEQKLNTQRDIAQTQLDIARENKNKFDKKAADKNKKK